MKSWKGNKDFLNLLKADAEVANTLPEKELESIFDYQYYLRYIDEIFERLGLTRAQWKDRMAGSIELSPTAI